MNKINTNIYSQRCNNIFNKVIKNHRLKGNINYINSVNLKLKNYQLLSNNISRSMKSGSKSMEYFDGVSNSIIEIKELLEKMDDKFLLFVVGMGNYGKSTLINALLQSDIAPVDFKPKTWKIDVYYLDENNSEKVILKLKDGTSKSLSYNEAVSFIEKEEAAMDKSISEYNKIKNVELRKCKNKEERNEMIDKLTKEYIYKSKVVEVRWPVKDNKYLKHMLLVDTPGLSQDIYDIKSSIKDYYFKADGVLWLLDGPTISAKGSNKLMKELEDYLEDIGGLNSNIIGVVNKIDTISDVKALDNIISDAKRFFGDKFKYILPISSKNACNNVNDDNLINLNKTIEDVFLSDSNIIKFNSKKLAVDKIMNNILNSNNEFIKFIEQKNQEYETRQIYIEKNINDMKSELEKDIEKIVNNYLKRVNSNIEIYTKNLFNIRDSKESKEYVKTKIFNLDRLQKNFDDFISSKHSLLDIEASKIYKYCTISEYKYINHIVNSSDSKFLTTQKLDLGIKSNFNVYTSLGDFTGDGLLDFIGGVVNELYKGVVRLLKTDSVKHDLRTNIEKIVRDSKKDVLKTLNSKIETINNNSLEIVNKSYEKILFPYRDFQKVEYFIKRLNDEINREQNLTLKDVFY